MYKLVAIALIAASITAADAEVRKTACPGDELCLSCNSTKCSFCIYSYADTAGICQRPTKEVKNCLNYSSATACANCNDGFYLKDNACVSITVPDCADVAVTAPTVCTICEKSKLPKATVGTCTDGETCTLQYCEQCTSNTQCAYCKSGYSLSNNVCVAETVKNCAALNGSTCSVCQPNYYNSASGCTATKAQSNAAIFSAFVALLAFFRIMA